MRSFAGRHIISLKDFVISNPEYLPDEVREKIENFTDYIDYWAVDFNYRDDTFHNMWQSFRMKKHPKLETKCSCRYEDSGKYQVLVKVVDIFGNDTNNEFFGYFSNRIYYYSTIANMNVADTTPATFQILTGHAQPFGSTSSIRIDGSQVVSGNYNWGASSFAYVGRRNAERLS